MRELIILTFFTVVLVWAWKISLSPGMVLESLGNRIAKKALLGDKFLEYLTCEWCVPSLFSFYVFIGCYFFEIINKSNSLIHDFFLYFFCVCTSSIVCGISWALYGLIQDTRESKQAEIKQFEVHTRHLKNVEKLSFWDVSERALEFKENKRTNN